MEGKAGKQHLFQSRKNSNSSNMSSFQSPCASPLPATKNPIKHTGSLEIIEGDASGLYSPDQEAFEKGSRPPSQGFPRPWSRSSIGSVPPRPDSSFNRRLPTPTKHVTLQTVKRKEENCEPFVPDIDFQKLNLDSSYNRAWNLMPFEEDALQTQVSVAPSSTKEFDVHSLQHATQLRLPRQQTSGEEEGENSSRRGADARERPGPSGERSEARHARNLPDEVDSQPADLRAANNLAQAAAENSDNDDGDESSEEEERKAPNELLMEFVECLMKKDYKNADKLCKMILMYEPTNPEALKFQPVIDEKLRLDAEAEAEEEDGDDDSDDDDDDDDDDDEDDNDDDDSSSDDDSDDDDDNDDEDDEDPSVFRMMAEAVASNYYQANEQAGDQRLARQPDSATDSDH